MLNSVITITVITLMEWTMKQQKPEGLKYSENTNQATLWQFKMVINTGDVRYLLILDDYDEIPACDAELLFNVWHSIFAEWSEIVGGSRSDLWLVKNKTLTIMKNDFERQSSLMRILKIYPHPDIIGLTREEGFVIDPENFDVTYEKAYTRLMRLKNQISIKEKEKEAVSDEKPEDFDRLIVTLEKHQGYQFDEHTMTVKKFANIYKTYKNAKAA